jgi:hypothetical protein
MDLVNLLARFGHSTLDNIMYAGEENLTEGKRMFEDELQKYEEGMGKRMKRVGPSNLGRMFLFYW